MTSFTIFNNGTINIATAKKCCLPETPPPEDMCASAKRKKPRIQWPASIQGLVKEKLTATSTASLILQLMQRWADDRPAASKEEEAVFALFENYTKQQKEQIRCVADRANALPASILDRGCFTDCQVVVTKDRFETAVKSDVLLCQQAFLKSEEHCASPVPGQIRLVPNTGEDDVFPSQVHIFKVNGFRTNDNLPPIEAQNYLSAERQSECTARIDSLGKVEFVCNEDKPPCTGNRVGDICLRIPQIQPGMNIEVEGVNFFDIQTYARITSQDGSITRDINGRVCGDLITPRTEILNNLEVPIADSRVADWFTFPAPSDLPNGIYRFEIVVPNTSTFHGLGFGDELNSNSQYFEILVNTSAQFKVQLNELHCIAETSPGWWGSDEVDLYVECRPIYTDLSSPRYPGHSKEYDNVDSGDRQSIEKVIYESPNPHNPLGALMFRISAHETDISEFRRDSRNFHDTLVQDILKAMGGAAFLTIGILGLIFPGSGAVALLYIFIIIGAALLLQEINRLIHYIFGGDDLLMSDLFLISLPALISLTRGASIDLSSVIRRPDDREPTLVRAQSILESGNGFCVIELRHDNPDEESSYALKLRIDRTA